MTEVDLPAVGRTPAEPAPPTVRPPVRTALISTRRLAIVCPQPELTADGQPGSTRLERLAAGLRHRARLAWTRLRFRLPRPPRLRVEAAQIRLRLKLALVRIRYRSRLGR